MAKYNGLRAGIMNENQGSLTKGNGGLSAQDIQDINTAVPGAGAQKFMNWQPDSRVGAAQPMNPMAGGGLSMDTPVDLSKPVAPAAIDAAFVKGRMAATDEQISIAKNTREEKRFGWEENEYKREVAIREGMAQASQLGGYTGVVEFLKQVDPDKALKFEMKKNDLDQALMSTDIYKMAASNVKLRVMVEGYDILSKMGAGLLFAKPEERASMYEGMKPLFAQVLGEGNVPETVEDATPMLMMAAAQNDPKNLVANANVTNIKAASTIGKLQQDARAYLQAGGSVDDKDYKDIQAQIEAQNNKAKQTEMVAFDMEAKQKQNAIAQSKNEIQAKNAAAQLDKTVNEGYRKDSKSYETYLEAQAKIDAAIQVLKQNPSDAVAQEALRRGIGMAYNKGAFGDKDAEAFASSDGAAVQVWKKFLSLGTGQVVKLVPDEIGALDNLAEHIKDVNETRQAKTNRFWQEQSKSYSTDNHQVKINYYQAVPNAAKEQLKQAPTPENIQYFKDTFNVSDTYIDNLLAPLKTPVDQVGE